MADWGWGFTSPQPLPNPILSRAKGNFQLAIQKKETEVSLRLTNFVLLIMNHLTSERRYEIYLGRKRGWSRSRIAREIGVHPSTVSRELQRNCNSNGEYVWINAQTKSDARRHGLQGNHRKPLELWWRIEQMIIDEDWSPAQIAGVLRKEKYYIH